MHLIVHVFITCKLRSRDQRENYRMSLHASMALCFVGTPHENISTLSLSVTIAQFEHDHRLPTKGEHFKGYTTEKKKKVWYLPYFAFAKPDNTAIKVRVVFNAKYKALSLNDLIFQRPKLYEVLIRFLVALVCNIDAMYL